ncbi:putative hsp70 nucleotide exchange factor fes1 protein [Botrytis fragariae]|uniref:Putative hsp70 nucleotide exchange factor fes1 protein n=1 Tax=Botrytis fragariae TaxID=1964551 RepID=A0A8H6AQ19_9HELO|nr:putative hsp70 nucleotide exchange factor fes1 protein [Botrytis fragariae]KAF5871393.1 putative hsp70 nucleotide exchange factor fes1 protein [Botrytis fragariae]
MAMPPAMNELLKWSVENSTATAADPAAPPPQTRALPADAMNVLFGGPSDADLMKASIWAVQSTDPEVTIEDKVIAFDNFEQLIENLDNANNIEVLELWKPLLEFLGHEEKEIRKMAAWCVGTAVQNNEKSQKSMLKEGGVPLLVRMCVDEKEEKDVRRKAVYALSSAIRNFQEGMDAATEELGKLGRSGEKIDAADMDACDVLIEGLREEAANVA